MNIKNVTSNIVKKVSDNNNKLIISETYKKETVINIVNNTDKDVYEKNKDNIDDNERIRKWEH